MPVDAIIAAEETIALPPPVPPVTQSPVAWPMATAAAPFPVALLVLLVRRFSSFGSRK